MTENIKVNPREFDLRSKYRGLQINRRKAKLELISLSNKYS